MHRVQSKRAGFTLVPTYNCNFRCEYCYEKGLQERGRPIMGKRIDEATVDAAFVAMEQLRHHDDSIAQITLYGGEPLLRSNVAIVEHILRRGTEASYKFTAITNGSDLEAFLHLLGPGKIEALQITLDGPARVHDQRRYRSGHRGTFAAITTNIDRALETGVTISVRTNIDRENIAHMPELASFYTDRGWIGRANFSANASTVYRGEADRRDESQFCSPLEIFETLRGLGVQVIDPLADMGRRFMQLLTGGTYPILRPAYCAGNAGQFILDPFGDIYPCWDLVCTDHKIGRFLPSLELNEERLAEWRQRTVTNIPECQGCKYALLCGGGCSYFAMLEKGGLYHAFCYDFEARLLQQIPEVYARFRARQSRQTTQA